MKCPNCAHQSEPAARFCAMCGTALQSLPTAPAEPAAAAHTQAPPAPSDPPPALGPAGGQQSHTPPKAPRTVQVAGVPEESRYWAMGAHLSALAGGFLGGLPAFLGPLIVWLVRKDTDPYAAGHGRDALNFNLSVLLYAFALLAFSVVTFGIGLLLAVPGWIGLGLAWLALSVTAAVKASSDQTYRYPLTIRFFK